jgi:hypothetical protein
MQHQGFVICTSSGIQATLPMLALAAMTAVLCGGSLARTAYLLPTLPIAAIVIAEHTTRTVAGKSYGNRVCVRQHTASSRSRFDILCNNWSSSAGHESSTPPPSWLGFAVSERRAMPAPAPPSQSS